MANASYLLILLAWLAVWQSGADDACDSVECLPSAGPVCALDEGSGSAALFADECVLRCTSCRLDTEFKKVNSSLCSTDAKYITVCPDSALDQDSEKPKIEDTDNGIAVVQVDIGSGDYDEMPPLFGESPLLPSPLLSLGSELLRRLVMSRQPEPPPPAPEGLTLITADVKVDVTINMPPPPPPPARLGLPPPLMMSLPHLPLVAPPPPPPPPPQTLELRLQPEQSDAYSAASPAACPSVAAALASLVALIVSAIHI